MSLPSNLYGGRYADALEDVSASTTAITRLQVEQLRAQKYAMAAGANISLLPKAETSYPTRAMLDKGAFNVPVEALCDVWVTRFGHAWVPVDQLDDDEFWSHAYKRLKSLGKIESHYLSDSAKFVCRAPE